MTDSSAAATLGAATRVPHQRAALRLSPALAAECLTGGLILTLAVLMRTSHLDGTSANVDEGIRGAQMLLMRAGYRPFQEIHASQGPLFLDLVYPLYGAFGGGLVGLRLAVAAYSLIAVAGAYWVGRQVAGPLGAAAAALLLVVSPTYLRYSRLALAETVALGPAVLAVGAALGYRRSGHRAWLLLAGGLLAISLAIKPITVAAALPVGLTVLLSRRRSWRPLALLLGVMAGLFVFVSLAVGLAGLFDKIVDYRLHLLQQRDWRIEDNWAVLKDALGRDQLALFGLALAGGAGLIASTPRVGLPLALWAVGACALLLFYSPLFLKHTTTVLPPVAILAGAGLGRWWAARGGRPGPWRGAQLAPLIALAWYLWSLPAALGWDLRLIGSGPNERSPAALASADVVRSIAALTERTEFVLTDEPYLPFLAERLVPPPLADTAEPRIRSRDLTGEEIAAAATAYPTKIAVLWTDNLRSLRRFRTWLDERYQVAKIYATRGDMPRYLYLRRDADAQQARAALTASLDHRSGAEVGADLRLGRYGLAARGVPSGGATPLTMEWEAIRPVTTDYHLIVKLVGQDGRVWYEQEGSLFSSFGGARGGSDGQPGAWVVWVATIVTPPDTPAGAYQVVVELHDTQRRGPAPVTHRPAGAREGGASEIRLARLEVY